MNRIPFVTLASAWLALAPTSVRAEDAPVQRVTIGAFLNDVQSIDLKQHTYAVDVYFWFRWTDPDLKPWETLEFTNPSELWGHVRTPSYEEPVQLPGGELYQVLRVQGRFSRKLLLTNYPFDRQVLAVEFEDDESESHELEFVPDANAATANPALMLPGFEVGTPVLTVTQESYPTNFGDTRDRAPDRFSRVRLELPIERPLLPYATKLLLPIFCVLLCAALMLMIRPTYVDARMGIGSTAMLTIAALQMTLNEDLPEVDYLVLMDKVYIAAYLVVLAGLAIVVRTTVMAEKGDVDRAERLQRRWLAGLIGSYVATMAAVIGRALASG